MENSKSPIRLSLDEEVALARRVLAHAEETGDKRLTLETLKVLSRLVEVESKCRDRDQRYIHRTEVAALGQAIVAIFARHMLGVEGRDLIIDGVVADMANLLENK